MGGHHVHPQGRRPTPTTRIAFIDFILDGEVHGAIAPRSSATPARTRAAIEFIPEADRTNPALYPPREILERCEVPVYKGEKIEQLYADALTRVLAA